MTVQEFVDEYKNSPDKQSELKKHITRDYIPFAEKQVIANTMISKTINTTEHEMKYIDWNLYDINFVLSIVLLYTDLQINSENPLNDYDLLEQISFSENVKQCIYEDYKRFRQVYEMSAKTFRQSEQSNYEMICKFINNIMTSVSSLMSITQGADDSLE